ncbi:BTB/POZ and MATH domain-containing protein 2 [Ananas comosus]|uniref:BTB/POZ and MATH domain-containing protein 2 n=1 Tax=Ananas comosus TaxID=4615 RepID=A0A199VJP6_ANACO|nr:BTB/POZ and MATH domain-containing protein 2 [Ananas comosus]
MAASSSSSSSALVTEAVSGSHRFKISGYSLMKGIGPGKIYDSAAFTVGGFDWAIRYYPGGQSQDDADYISLFVVLACEAMDVKAQYKITLLDHWKRPSSTTPTDCEQRSFSSRGKGWGFSRFMRRADLEASQYLKDDCFLVKVTLNVIKEPRLEVPMARSLPQPPPSGLHLHLLQLLESGEGTDVAFEVGGETFAAHRWLLAARSPVFKVELLGPMKEKSMQRIKIEDVEAVVFKALLHFIYSDSVPDLIKELAKESPALMAQHLLAAADRYGLERLRLICEDKLCEQVDVSTVATTLALAEQHRCDRLKAACLEFVASPEVLIAVMLTDGFEHLKKSCPLVVNDLMEKFGCLFYSIRKEQSENEN